ncbi:hypothetical protein [Acidocella sp.]|uniref:hypothetical protein n=1 Tax=Acidocella sp. TaxID=50710 RepID=UPI002F3E7498
MPKFRVNLYPVYLTQIEVEAPTPRDAENWARERFEEHAYGNLIFADSFEEPIVDLLDNAGDWLPDYRVHHDLGGWYIVEPGEEEPEDGDSLGFDGREHYATEADAWAAITQSASLASVEA